MLQWFISFSEFTEFSESSAPFRKNSNGSLWLSLSRTSVNISTRQCTCHLVPVPVPVYLVETPRTVNNPTGANVHYCPDFGHLGEVAQSRFNAHTGLFPILHWSHAVRIDH